MLEDPEPLNLAGGVLWTGLLICFFAALYFFL